MKKYKFNTRRVNVPRFKWRDKSHSCYLAMPFGRVLPSFWNDIAPNESFRISEGTKLLSSPYVAPVLSDIFIKTRYFAVPLRKAVPNFEEWILSEPSDNIMAYHTTIYNALRLACLPSSNTSYDFNIYNHGQENIKEDGLLNYIGVPWLLDQLCCIIFGRDLQYMEEWTAALLAAGCNLDSNGNFQDFKSFFIDALFNSSKYDDGNTATYYFNLAFYFPATGGTAPNYTYSRANLAYYSNDNMPFYCLDFAKFLEYSNTSYSNVIDDIYNETDHSFQSYIEKNVYGSNNPVVLTPSGLTHAVDTGVLKLLSDPNRDGDNTDTFFGTPIRLAPFCAYQKVRYDWFVDLRLNDNLFEEFCNHYEQTGSLGSANYVSWSDSFYFTSQLSGSTIRVNILTFLFTSFVIDYQKDYFTTCAFEPQAGPDLVIGPSGKLPLMFEVETSGVTSQKSVVAPPGYSASSGEKGELSLIKTSSPFDTIGSVWAQINESEEITPIKLRWQMALQNLLERRNIGGYSRYTDLIFGQYGIRVPDPYLQRSIYLGGFRTYINTNEVVAKADGQSLEGSSMLGDVGGYGRGYSHSQRLGGHLKEHCIVVGVTYIVPKNYYTQGMPTRLTDLHVLDMPHYQFQGVGEQPVLNREIFLGDKPSEVFGYQSRYSDKKIQFDRICGEFLSTLRYWHTGRKFMSQPRLNQALLSLNGADGHNDILALSPSVAMPFRLDKHISFQHKMCV